MKNLILNNLIERFTKKKENNDESDVSHVLVSSDTPFAIREAYRALYTNVLYLNIEDKCKKIVVTSAVSGEGKSTTSVNLAINLAQNLENKKVLIIDADMRCPNVSKILGLNERANGLSEYLAGIDKDPRFDYLPQYRLMVLTAGGRSVNPTKLIGSEAMKRLIAACEAEFDYIIIDTPPVTVVTDAVLFNNIANGYIIVTRSEYSNINRVKECMSKLEQVGAEIYGLVLTDDKTGSFLNKYSRYSKYSKYSKYAKYAKYSKYAKYDNDAKYNDSGW